MNIRPAVRLLIIYIFAASLLFGHCRIPVCADTVDTHGPDDAPASGAAADSDANTAAGSAADSARITSDTASITAPTRELRAAWVATVYNLDWPGNSSLSSDEQKTEFITVLDDICSWGFNAVIVQIRGFGDSLYPSDCSPWSSVLTGTQGSAPDPYYDPLAFMIEEAHKRNLEFHAWFNPFRLASSADTSLLCADHPAVLYPDWVVEYANSLYINPGIPQARRFVIDSILEAVQNYDIDAVHMDDYFYPYPVSGELFDDLDEFSAYGSEYKSISDFRRAAVNDFVKNLYIAIKRCKPSVQLGISPYGVWRNKYRDNTGSDTTAGSTSYDSLYADARRWFASGWVDYLMPQIYWHTGQAVVPFESVSSFWWKETLRNKFAHMHVGLGVYKLFSDTAWSNPDELPSQLALLRSYGDISGIACYRYTSVKTQVPLLGSSVPEIFGNTSFVPAVSYCDSTAPSPCNILMTDFVETDDTASALSSAPRLFFSNGISDQIAYCALYRFDGTQLGSFDDTKCVLTTINLLNSAGIQSCIDTSAQPGHTYTYALVAFDRAHNASAFGRSVTVTAPLQ